MITEIILDIRAFILIFLTSVVAYGHIMYTIDADSNEKASIQTHLREAYTMALGDFQDYNDYTVFRYIVFTIFTLMIPTVLVNMLIAIMGATQ